jgi:hypothetical protein
MRSTYFCVGAGRPSCATDERIPVKSRSPALVIAAVVIGLLLIALAVVYWAEPAGSLPSFMPGHEAGSGHHHVKHGIAAFLLGVALLVFAWFQTGPNASRGGSTE